MDNIIEVRHHNAITNARYEYTEMQLDIFLYLLSRLQKERTDDVYEVSVNEMSKLTGKKYNYQQLRHSTEGMGSRMFEIPNETDNKGRKIWRQMWMFERIDYIHGTGIIEFQFTRTIQPYLFDLKDNFTSFQLYSALRLSSKHAKRVYTLCNQWKDKHQTPVQDIEEFKRTLGLITEKGEEYVPISMFKKRVLDEAVKQINTYTDLEISYDLKKKGRSFKTIQFFIKKQPISKSLPIDEAITPSIPSEISESQYNNARINLETWNITRANIVTQIMSSATLIQEVNKFAYQLQTGKIKIEKNIAGYLLKRLGIS